MFGIFPFDNAGKHFRIGVLENKRVVVVMCGLGMVNKLSFLHFILTFGYVSPFVFLNRLASFCVAKCRYFNPVVAYFI